MIKTLNFDTLKRYLTLKTHHIYTMPIAILMPHSGCNCQCIMCDIWKGNGNTQQLTTDDVHNLLDTFRKLKTQWVVMSGGEALMNPNLFRLCDILRTEGIKITILSTGLLLKRYAKQIVAKTNEVIVSLDGSEDIHNLIRRIPNAYQKLHQGVQAIKSLEPNYRITARCVIQNKNFADWPNIIKAAHDLGLNQISFYPADVSTEAFNHPELWTDAQTADVKLTYEDLPQLKTIINHILSDYQADFKSGFIAESPQKISEIYNYYAALHNLESFPPVQCNAPWVSTVVEADGTVRPCFFHKPLGNIQEIPLMDMLNTPEAIAFRRNLDMDNNAICHKCVCSLNLRPTSQIG